MYAVKAFTPKSSASPAPSTAPKITSAFAPLLSPVAAATGHLSVLQSPARVKPSATPLASPKKGAFFNSGSTCRKNDLTQVLSLIDESPSFIQQKDAEGKLPVHHAAIRCAKLPIIEALVVPFRDSIFAKDDAGKTPLNYADQYYASDKHLEALNDKRRMRRDEKVRLAREKELALAAEAERQRLLLEEDAVRENIETLTTCLENLAKANASFFEIAAPNVLSTPLTLAPVPLAAIGPLHEAASSLVKVLPEVTASPAADTERLDRFLTSVMDPPRALNEKIRKWATKCRDLVRRNKSYCESDASSKLLLLVALDEPLGRTSSEERAKPLDRFGDLVKELVWRCKKMRLLNLAQEYHVTLETLSAQFEAKEWQSKAEQDALMDGIGRNVNLLNVTSGPDAVTLDKSVTHVTKLKMEKLKGVLKELRMMQY
ncbi:hypothetical protein TeGR_g5441 [Tetraparma gracilis]|uniref:Uncharacterized protein n=1 Tax=Tetraparma gracilis TaxID=2962635 RepID=A0ABQ6MYG6_9STRA|nr:hypothetical protein TeGR_g5441 [Tetraparma gracilis]